MTWLCYNQNGVITRSLIKGLKCIYRWLEQAEFKNTCFWLFAIFVKIRFVKFLSLIGEFPVWERNFTSLICFIKIGKNTYILALGMGPFMGPGYIGRNIPGLRAIVCWKLRFGVINAWKLCIISWKNHGEIIEFQFPFSVGTLDRHILSWRGWLYFQTDRRLQPSVREGRTTWISAEWTTTLYTNGS